VLLENEMQRQEKSVRKLIYSQGVCEKELGQTGFARKYCGAKSLLIVA